MATTNPQHIPRSASLDALHPTFRERLERGITLARAEGLPVHIFETTRTPERQNWLYGSGRTYPGKIITKASAWSSFHQYAVAADLAFDADIKTPKIEWTWDGNWKRLGEILMAQGLEWFGAPGSKFPEAPHFQLTGGITIMVARMLYNEGGLPAVWRKIDELLKGGAK